MAAVMPTISSDDHSRPDSPVTSSASQIPIIEAPESLLAVDQLDGPSLASTLKLPDTDTQFLSPIPTTKPTHSIFQLSDLLDENGSLETILGAEFGKADITVAADGSFIDTSSGTIAREIKLRYDQLAGVGPALRSPYTVLGFVNQHGRSMYRISHRDEHSAPAASAAEVEERVTQSKTSDPSGSPRAQRRSRLSGMHFPPVMNFARSTITPTARPPTASSTTSSSGGGRKLRKTRSIPDMSSTEPIVTSAPTFAVTGRGHSQSVTAVDHPRPSMVFSAPPPERQIDAFAELMDWFTPSSSASSNFSSHSLFNPGKVSSNIDKPRASILQPFGNGITFNAPSQKPLLMDQLPTPRYLREMQSFESGLTAKQVDPQNEAMESDSLTPVETDNDANRPPSAIRLSAFSLPPLMPEDMDSSAETLEPMSHFAPSAESLRLSSHYSTEVFNVLQTYRGLPLFEKLVPEVDEGTTVIKLSLAADESAAPRDDPRFVIWGETLPENDLDDYYSTSRDSLMDASPSATNTMSSSSISRRRNSRVSRLLSSEASSSSKLPATDGQRVLLAATIERWIAQLTSDLNYDELLNFFLTYRTYVSAVDLCHLLICRFHWALQQPSSRQDEKVRRIVRVRTFVAIRYWLLTFFTVDFIPNRELRLLIADWLNTLIHDPILKKHSDGIDIVRRLVKVAKECKRAHTRPTDRPKANSPPSEEPVDHVLGKSFAEAIRKLPDDGDSDLDLDFLPDEAKSEETITGFPSDPANAHLTAGHGHGVLSGNRPTSLPLSSLTILQRTDHAPGPNAEAEALLAHNPSAQLTIRHSTLSRAFMRTITRLGRWKRVLNPKSSARPTSMGPCGAGVSAFDLEISDSRDLLTSNGDVEKFLGLVSPPNPAKLPSSPAIFVAPSPTLSVLPPIPPVPTTPPPVPHTIKIHYTPHQSPLSSLNFTDDMTATPIPTNDVCELPSMLPLSPPSNPTELPVEVAAEPAIPVVTLDETDVAEDAANQYVSEGSFNDEIDRLSDPRRAESFRSSSTDSFGAPLTTARTFPGKHNQWAFDVVSIDDLDFSDTSSILPDDPAYPPGLRKPPRKLPMRRDFEFVRHSEASSMGIISHESMRDSITSSTNSETSPTSSGPQKPIHRWQLKSLQQTFESMSNNEDDNGDVEAALRRLEGQINPKVQQEKAEKVDGWVRNLQERMANGDYDYESSLYSEDDVEGFIDEVDQPVHGIQSDPTELESTETYQDDVNETAQTPMPTQTTHHASSTSADSSPGPKDSKPLAEDVVPLEILQSRVMPSPEASAAVLVNPTIETVISTKFANPDSARIHSSFILAAPADRVAEQFAMIDRELFMGVKFEELVTEEWAECEDITVFDWATYLKDRARWKAESRFAEKTSALAAVRARFNLMVSFVISEIVLTPPTERPFVVSKFIRVAWKSYSISNFNTLTAIITALQNEWVTKAMRKPGWSRIGVFESRMYRDLKQFTTPADDFKFMRQVVESIVDSKPLETGTHSASVVSNGDSQSGKSKVGSESRPVVPSACIPFIGIYLSRLHRLNKLPALIDPTAPNSVIGIDSDTAIFDPPAHPEVFSALTPLPASMHLEPLINVHKQRRIADVIKSLVAGQHLASRVQFPIDKKIFTKCLRLGGLSAATLQKALAVYPD